MYLEPSVGVGIARKGLLLRLELLHGILHLLNRIVLLGGGLNNNSLFDNIVDKDGLCGLAACASEPTATAHTSVDNAECTEIVGGHVPHRGGVW